MAQRFGITLAAILILTSSCEAHTTQEPKILGGTNEYGGFTTLSPDPKLLQWDPPSKEMAEFRAGWLNVPVLQDKYLTAFEKSPRVCLRVLMKPAKNQPAKLGPILLHCGGPGSDANCAFSWGKWFELNSSALVGAPLSDDYDYWSISQRGMRQEVFPFNSTCPFTDDKGNPLQVWPQVQCNGIDKLIDEKGVEEVLARLDGSPDKAAWSTLDSIRKGPGAQTFGVPFYNETYARWFYRLVALEQNLCYNHDKYKVNSRETNRTYNLFDHMSTGDLSYDIELFRQAIGAKKMSVYGVSYGTKVGSVYATLFPSKVHRLILDGDMGSDPDIANFAEWVGESTEAVWTGLAVACDNSVMSGAPMENRCPAGPGVTRKFHKLFMNATKTIEKSNALELFWAMQSVVYTPGVPGAASLMKCIANMSASTNCSFGSPLHYPGTVGLEGIASVLGMDFAGRMTEEAFIEWWRVEKDVQPLGITRSFATTVAVGTWPAVPRPNPPAGNPLVAPLVIGNLHDGQTPYRMAQRMYEAFPSGRLLTTQFYGHGMQGPENVTAVVERYEEEMGKGVTPTYDDEVAKLLCVKVALIYLKNGSLPRDYVCKAAGPVMTGPGPEAIGHGSATRIFV